MCGGGCRYLVTIVIMKCMVIPCDKSKDITAAMSWEGCICCNLMLLNAEDMRKEIVLHK
jgi:hypothetical protein